jgi:hypothetical protein
LGQAAVDGRDASASAGHSLIIRQGLKENRRL